MGGTWVDWVFLLVTGGIAAHGLTYRDASGDAPWVHLLFGSIAALFFLKVLLQDVLQVVKF
ncbi:MAG: hypothetical protein ACR2PO_17080 [Methyloligellaceae bacterium]